jgi:hypothetical protein
MAATATREPTLVIGVLAAPANVASRKGARATWLRDAVVTSGNVVVRFVLGHNVSQCVRFDRRRAARRLLQALRAEAARFADLARVVAPDCEHSTAAMKVHAWFQHALHTWPRTPWLAKLEDDALLWPSALVADLTSLRHATYYGVLRWVGVCGGSDSDGCTRTCFGGTMGAWAKCDPLQRCLGHFDNKCCEHACPRRMRFAPFAAGPLDVRHRTLATHIANCAAATSFFEAASSPRCAGVGNIDAGQGVALSRCADGNRSLGRLVLADATDARLAMGSCPRDHHKHTCRALARPAPEWHLSG